MDYLLKWLGLGTLALVARLLLVFAVMGVWLYLADLVLPYVEAMFDALSEATPNIGPFEVPVYGMMGWMGVIDGIAITLAAHATIVTLSLAIYIEQALRGIGG